MTEEQSQKVYRALLDQGAVKPCSRCGFESIEVVGAMPLLINEEFSRFLAAKEVVPSVIVGCKQCGHLWLHSIGLLGLSKEFGGSGA